MLPSKEIGCHRTGFEKDCRALVADGRCTRWIQIQGKHPQTGEDISKWDCVDNFGPLLQVDNTQQVRHVGASVDRLNNDVVTMGGVAAVQMRVLNDQPAPHLIQYTKQEPLEGPQ